MNVLPLLSEKPEVALEIDQKKTGVIDASIFYWLIISDIADNHGQMLL